VGGLYSGAKVLGATLQDGKAGLFREGTQVAIDYGIGQALPSTLVGPLTKFAVRSGASAAGAFGAAGLAFTGGQIAGTYLRDSPLIGQGLGLRGTIGDEVDERWFRIAPDALKEWASGTPQVDVDSPEWQARMRADAERRRRQMAFDRVAADNVEQQRQMQASQAAAVPPATPSEEPGAGLAPSIAAALQSMGQLQSQVRAPRTNAAPAAAGHKACTPARTLDPKTGCHPGHDEGSHPGGCKCG
jgi:hypothetical protein